MSAVAVPAEASSPSLDDEGLRQRRAALAAELAARWSLGPLVADGDLRSRWQGKDPEDGTPVTLEVLSPAHPSFDPRQAAEEARALARVRHPNLVAVHDAGQSDGHLWVAYEHQDEVRSLRQRLAEGPLEGRADVGILLLVGEALDALHAAGLVHRDLRAETVWLDRLERPVLGLPGYEFLLADDAWLRERELRGLVAGTAPEDLAAGTSSAGGDLYAFAGLCFEALTGRPARLGWEVWRAADGAPWPQAIAPSRLEGLAGEVAGFACRGLAADPALRPDGASGWSGEPPAPASSTPPDQLLEALRTRRLLLVGMPGHPAPGASWGLVLSAILMALFAALGLWTTLAAGP